jgi:tellurite resistance protein TerC
VPLWLWGVAATVVAAVAAADLVLSRRRDREPGLREAAWWTVGVVALGALFGGALAAVGDSRASGQFFAGWLTEYSLSLDNLFVFVLLISRSAVAARLRSRVLLLGIALALFLRALFIAAGAAALNSFDWVLYVFGAVLLITAGRMAFGGGAARPGRAASPSREPPGGKARTAKRRADGRLASWLPGSLRRGATGPLLALAGAIAATDLVFAMDSIPAVFGLTRDPYLVLAANAFALLGLRHLYFLIGGLLERLVHLSAGLSAILGFIGVKLLSEALTQSGVERIGPVPVPDIGTGLSLCVIGGVLATVTVTSLLTTRSLATRSLTTGSLTTGRGRLRRSRAAKSARQRPRQEEACGSPPNSGQ